MDIHSDDIYVDEEVRALKNKKTKNNNKTNLPLSSLSKNIVPGNRDERGKNTGGIVEINTHQRSINDNKNRKNTIDPSSSSNFHNRRSYVNDVNDANKHDKSRNMSTTVNTGSGENSQFNNITKKHKCLFAPSMRIDTQHVQNVIAATTNYLRRSLETSSPASTVSNMTPHDRSDIDMYEKKSSVGSIHSVNNNNSSISNVTSSSYSRPSSSGNDDRTQEINSDDRGTTLTRGPRIISASHYNSSHTNDNNNSDLVINCLGI